MYSLFGQPWIDRNPFLQLQSESQRSRTCVPIEAEIETIINKISKQNDHPRDIFLSTLRDWHDDVKNLTNPYIA
jgi:hypothetical protein